MRVESKILKQFQSEDIFVNIRIDSFDESFYGFIRIFNDNFLLLEVYDSNGFYDGIIIFRNEDISRVQWDNNNVNSIFKTLNKKEQDKRVSDINIDSIENILQSVNKAYKYVTIFMQELDSEICIIGEIVEMDDQSVVLKEFGTKSTLDRGMTLLSLKDITRVEAGGIYENNLLKVHKEK
jgi:hypothetical protein